MLLLNFRPTRVSEFLEISMSVQLSPEEHSRAQEAASPDIYFRRFFACDPSLLPLNYALTRCEATRGSDCQPGIWNLWVWAKRKQSQAAA